MRAILMLSVAFYCAGCAKNRPIVSTPPAACADLVPAEWADGVPAAEVPANTDLTPWLGKPLTPEIAAAIQLPWVMGYNAQDSQLDKANGRTHDAMVIQRKCEALVNMARPENR